MASFDLVDLPWIPCVMLKDGATAMLGLRRALQGAPEIREIVDPSPLVVMALHRVLLALLHRTFGPESQDRWAEIWRRGAFDSARLDRYFAVWRDQRRRFDLFDERHPFYQASRLDFGYAAPISRLAHELNLDTSNALFNHTLADAVAIDPAKAARYLIAYHAFAAGGLVTYERGTNPALYRSADAAPLTKGAVVLVRGESLFETLMLNFHWYDRASGEPFEFRGEDAPAWERDEETQAGDRAPDGYVDLLTWQSRRIRLRPDVDQHGNLVVRSVVIMKGAQFPDGFQRHGKETMLAFQKREDAKAGMDPWPAVAFQEDRALWRDSTALLQPTIGGQARPKTLGWLGDLIANGVLRRGQAIPLDVAGLGVDRAKQAKVNLWRHERLALPPDYLTNPALFATIKSAIELSEKAAGVLDHSAWILATRMVSPGSDAKGGRQPDANDVRRLVDRLSIGRRYWPRLEAPFGELLAALPADAATTSDEVVYGSKTLPAWAGAIGRAAGAAFRETTGSLDTSGRALKAVTKAAIFFNTHLSPLLADYRAPFEEVTR